MAKPNPIKRIMEAELPSKTYQRRKLFRPDYDYIKKSYRLINRNIFDNQLYLPKIYIKQTRGYWGCCTWKFFQQSFGTYCTITLSDKWFCESWFIQTLAHEMVHQYQWDIYRFEYERETGRKMPHNTGAHGPSFYAWRGVFDEYGLDLKISHGQKRWFKYQTFDKC